MVSVTINKYFNSVMKIAVTISILFILIMLYIFSRPIPMYDNKNPIYIFGILLLIVLYIYLLPLVIILTGLFGKFLKLLLYIIFAIPIIPDLFIFYSIYQTREFIDNDIIIMASLYLLLLIFTIVYVVKNSYDLVGLIVGKEIVNMGDDFFAINVLSKDTCEGDVNLLIKDIITNLLKYKFIKSNNISDTDKKYKILNYRRMHLYKQENIILTELYIKVTDDNKLIKITDGFDDEKNTYKCIYIHQYNDDGEKISQLSSNFGDVYLAIKGLLPEGALIHKDDDITPNEIRSLHDRLFRKYFIIKYGTLIDKAEIKMKDILLRLKEPYKKPLKYGFISFTLLFILIYAYNKNYLPTLDTPTIVLIILGVPAFIYYCIKIYEWFNSKNKST